MDKNNSDALPVADVHFSGGEKEESNVLGTVNLCYPIHLPQDDKNDSFITIRATVLRDIQRKLIKVSKRRLMLADVLMAFGTTFLGLSLSPFLNNSDKNIWTGTVFPVLTAVFLVSYFFVKTNEVTEMGRISKEILEKLPQNKKDN